MADRTAIRRVFLGWRRPFLGEVASWLFESGEIGDDGEASSRLLVVPGRRAGRRLLELSTLEARRRALGSWIPPRILTLGALPEALPMPRPPTAGRLERLVTLLDVLRGAGREGLKPLAPWMPEDEDLGSWLDLAREIDELAAELAVEGLTVGDVRQRCADFFTTGESARWRTLEQLDDLCERRLLEAGLRGRHRARLDMLDRVEGGSAADPPEELSVLLVGVPEVGDLFRRLLAGARVLALVQAPAELEAAFDAWGCPDPSVWQERQVDLSRVGIEVVDRPRDGLRWAARLAGGWARGEKGVGVGPEGVTIGLPDSSLTRALEEELELAQLEAHAPRGRPLLRSRPARLLAGLGRFHGSRRLAELAALLRHPDVERFVRRYEGEEDWLSLLDRFTSETLVRELGPNLPGAEQTPSVRRLADRLLSLLPDGRRSLRQWAEILLDVLRTFYGDAELSLERRDEEELAEALGLLAEALREQAELRAPGPRIEASTAVSLLLGTLSDSVLGSGERSRSAGVEILGWLELALDDAPALVVTGLNEGTIPESLNAHPFLPDRTRRRLGLADNRRRFARDLFLLSALVSSKERLGLGAARRSVEDEPLVPSRLLLTAGAPAMVKTLRSFFGPTTEAIGAGGVPDAEEPVAELWTLPPPPGDEPVPRRLPVTAFRDYLRCPYRFYLRHVLRLRELRDLPVELDAAAFGRLAHEVLRRFGSGPGAESREEAEVFGALQRHLQEAVSERFGPAPPSAVRLQVEQLRRRLQRFARWQAEERRRGWRIEPTLLESRLDLKLEVEGESAIVHGRVDRIDRHPDLGYRIVDYKTADRPQDPEGTHRSGGEWVDLQLPLYYWMARGAGIERPVLGYVRLSQDLSAATWKEAEWTPEELVAAREMAREVVRRILDRRFWPPGEPPPFDDGLRWICGDGGRAS